MHGCVAELYIVDKEQQLAGIIADCLQYILHVEYKSKAADKKDPCQT